MRLYLDSSAIVKRYVLEPGSSAVDYVFEKGWAGELTLTTSISNVGEVLGILDVRLRRGWLSKSEFEGSLEKFAGEITRLMRMKALELLPVHTATLTRGWPLILGEHIYEGDAVQIIACRDSGSDFLLTSDKKLVDVTLRLGLKALDPVDENELKKKVV